MLLAVDYLRNSDFLNMEKEVSYFYYSMRYKSHENDFFPFDRCGYIDKPESKRHNIFRQATKALLLISYFHLIGGNFAKARKFVDNIFQLDFSLMPESEKHLHYTVILRTQIQVAELDIQFYNASSLFAKNSYFAKINFVETATQLCRIVDQFKNRIRVKLKGKLDSSTESSRLSSYRLMALGLIVLKCRTMSAIGKCRIM